MDFRWVRGHAICTKDVTKELKVALAVLALELVQGQTSFTKALEYCRECLVVVLLSLAKDEDVVADVDCARDAVQSLADCVLEYFCSTRYSEIESLVAHEPKVGAEGGNVDLDSGASSSWF